MNVMDSHDPLAVLWFRPTKEPEALYPMVNLQAGKLLAHIRGSEDKYKNIRKNAFEKRNFKIVKVQNKIPELK